MSYEARIVETKGVPESLRGNERISSKSLKVGYSADEKTSGEAAWVRQQRKAFQRWCNAFLIQRDLSLKELEEDIGSGVLLCNLLELLSGKKLPSFNKAPKMKVQKVLNSQIALDFITKVEKLKLVGIGPEDIFDGKTKLILGLIWTLILRFQIQAGKWTVAGKKTTAKSELLEWCNAALADENIQVNDFDVSWKSGEAVTGLVNYLLRQKGSAPIKIGTTDTPLETIDKAFSIAEAEFSIPPLLDANDMDDPDELSVMTYVSYFRQKDKLTPEDHAKRSQTPRAAEQVAPAPVATSSAAPRAAPTRTLKTITAEGRGLSMAVCGEEASFSLLTKDENGEVFYQADTVFIGTLVLASQEFPAKFTDKKDGIYVGNYTVQTAGTYDLTILRNQKPITAKPFKVTAEPGPAWGPTSHADGKGLSLTRSGEPNQFKIWSVDRFNNAIQKGGNKIIVRFEGPEDVKEHIRDEQNGSYLVEYSIIKTGIYKIHVSINGEPIKESPFRLSVEGGEISARNVTVEGEGLSRVVAGEIARFLVHVRDKFGNVSVKHGEARSISARLVGPSELDGAVEDTLNGSYTVTYEPTVSGKHKLYVRWNDEDTSGSPFDVTVLPGPLSAGKSSAEGDGLSKVVVGAEAHFIIISRDAYRNKITVGGAHIEVILQLEGHEAVHGKVTDNGDGTYKVIYLLKIVGTYKLTILIGGKHLQGSPFNLLALAGAVDPHNTFVEGPAFVSGAPVDEFLYLTIRPRDAFGNAAAITSYDDLRAESEGPDSLNNTTIKPNHGDSTLTLSTKPTAAGDYLLHFKLKGVDIKGSPYKIKVLGAKASAAHSTAEGEGLHTAVAGTKATFRVLAKDETGKGVTFGGASIGGFLEGAQKTSFAEVIDHENGTYTVHYIPKTAGFQHLHVSYDGYGIHNSPFGLVVAPGKISAKESVAFGPGISDAVAGVPAHFSVEVRDSYGNIVPHDNAAKVHAVLRGPSNITAKSSENKEGTYNFEYLPEATGEYKLEVSVDGEQVKGSPFNVKVAPGAFSPSHSVAEGKGLEEAIAGEVAKFSVLPKDAFGNTVADRVEVAAAFEGLPIDLHIAKAAQGLGYAAEYTINKIGNFRLNVGVAGVPVKNSPFRVNVLPAPVEPDNFLYEGASSVASGEKSSFTVYARDRFGNEVHVGGAKVEAYLLKFVLKEPSKIFKRAEGLLGSARKEVETEGEKIRVNVSDRHNGSYVGDYTLSSAGEYGLHLSVNGAPLKGSPFVVTVTSGAVDVQHTIVRGRALNGPIIAGDEIKLEILPRDKLGNPARLTEQDKPTASIKNLHGDEPATWQIQPNADGTLFVEALAKKPGKYLVSFTINDKPVNGSPFEVVVEAGKISAKNSYAEGAGLSAGVSGVQAHAIVYSRDDRDTPIPTGGAQVTATILGPEEPACAVHDNKDGTYGVSYVPKLAGTYSLLLKAEGLPIKNAPFSVLVSPGESSAKNSVADGPGLRETPAGVPAEFTVHVRDQFGNNIKEGGHKVHAALAGPEEITAHVTDKHDGTYAVAYTAKASGIYSLQVSLAGQPVKDSPFNVEVIPGHADAAHTTAEGKGLTQATANETSYFVIIARDVNGNKVPGAAVKALLKSRSSTKEPTEPIVVTDNHDGTYTAYYTVGVVGDYHIEVVLNGHPIHDSPFKLQVDAGATSTSNTTAEGEGLTHAVSGKEAHFSVISKDSNGNLVGKGGSNVEVSLKGPEHIDGKVVDKHDGTYQVHYIASLAGNYSLRVKIDKEHIHNSPFKVTVAPGPLSAAKSIAIGESLTKATCGITEKFLIHAKDAAGNNVPLGGAPFSAVLEGDKKVDLPVEDNGDGTYSVEYTPVVSGPHLLHVGLKGEPVKDSPFSVSIAPGSVSAVHTTAEGEGLNTATAGEPALFVVVLKDAYGNKLRGSSAGAIAAKVEGGSDADLYDNNDGTVRVQYTVAKSGPHHIHVTSHGAPITGSPFLVKVQPAVASPSHSYAHGEGLAHAKAGQPAKFLVQTADVFDNKLLHGGVGITSVLEGPQKLEAKVVDLNDGTYAVEYVPTLAGAYKVHTSFNSGGEIKESPHHLTVAAGEPIGANSVFDEVTPSPFGEAGQPFHVKIGARDAFGNHIPHGGLQVHLSAKLEADGAEEELHVTDEKNGTYSAKHTVTKSGVYLLKAKVGDELTKGSPLRYEIRAAEIFPETTHLTGPDTITSGETAAFIIDLKDKFGNPVYNTADVAGGLVPVEAGDKVPASVSHHEKAYHLDFKPVKAGPFKLEAKLNGHPVKGTPKHIVVAPARASLENTQVTFENAKEGALGPAAVKAGIPAIFAVKFVDQFGNVSTPPPTAVKADLKPVFVAAPVTLGSLPVASRQRSSSGSNLNRGSSARTLWAAQASRSSTNLKAGLETPLEPVVPAISAGEKGLLVGKFVPKAVGKYALELSLEDTPVKAGPFEVVVEAGPISPAHALVEGLQATPAGEPIHLTIVLRDEFGNKLSDPASISGVSVAANVEGDGIDEVKPIITTNPDGTFGLEFTGNKVGHYKTHINVNNTPVDGSPFVVVVDAGAVHPAHCIASGDGLHTANVGEPSLFDIITKDKGGNRCLTGGSAAVSFLQGPEKVDATIIDNNDGSYRASYIVNHVGEYKLHVVVDGKPISASPFDVVSKSGKPHPDGTVVEGKFELESGEPRVFTIRLRDKAGNAVKTGQGVHVAAALVPLGQVKADDDLAVGVADNGDGTYSLKVPGVKKSGKYDFNIDLDGVPLKGSPFHVVVHAGAPKKVLVSPNDNGFISAVAGQSSSFDLQPIDEYGNIIPAGHSEIECRVDGPSKWTGKTLDNDDGSYTVPFRLTLAGVYDVLVSIGGHNVPTNVKLEVLPGELSPAHAVVIGAGIKKAKASEEAKFLVQSVDKHGNEIAIGGAEVVAFLKGPESSDEPEHVDATVVDNGNGMYNVAYTVNFIGRYTLHVTIDGTNIASSPFSVRVTSGTAVATKSIVKPLSNLPAGRAKSDEPAFKIQLRDRNGYNKTKGGEELEVYLRKPIRKPAKIIDHKDGTYDVIYPKGLEVGEYEVIAELRGERFEIPNSSVTVEEPGDIPEEEKTLLEDTLPTSSSYLTNFLRTLDDAQKVAFLNDLRSLKK